ncbi:MAG: hypothetical protein K6U87_06150 [Firmicutes bacterium]|nr:hypothetical protein [Bacillota bacterium]
MDQSDLTWRPLANPDAVCPRCGRPGMMLRPPEANPRSRFRPRQRICPACAEDERWHGDWTRWITDP